MICISALFILRKIFELKAKNFSTSKLSTLLFVFVFFTIWAIEEISWGQRVFNYSWDTISNVNSQSEINFHNLTFFQPHLHKGYYILGLIISFLCLIKKKNKFSLLPDKSILYFFLLPSLYFLVGEIFLNFPINIKGEYVLRKSMFYLQEPNEFLLSLGAFLYSLKILRIKKK